MTGTDFSQVASRVGQLRQRIANAGGKDVKLIAVTKTFAVSAMVAAFDAGCDGVGENYAQELIAKSRELPLDRRLPVHFIGRLQTNKVKSLASVVNVWQTVDRPELINEIAKRCLTQRTDGELPRAMPQIMLQVNSTDEPEKGGCLPVESRKLLELATSMGLEVLGLMTVGPTRSEPDQARKAFRMVRQLATELGLAQCSMGMTGDLEIAVEEGATMIRVGSALFGARS